MKDIYLLQIETATPVCSVAISRNGHTLSHVDGHESNLHASHLTVFIEEALAQAQIAPSDLDGVAVSMGPGSYTGLRIGVSTAKGLCYGLDIPLIAVNTLDSMMAGFVAQGNATEPSGLYVPMIDARRMEVYMATYDVQGAQTDTTSASIIDEHYFAALATGQQYTLFGSGADKFESIFASNADVNIVENFSNTAAFLSILAFEKYQQAAFEDLVYFEPFYLKDFVATTPKKR